MNLLDGITEDIITKTWWSIPRNSLLGQTYASNPHRWGNSVRESDYLAVFDWGFVRVKAIPCENAFLIHPVILKPYRSLEKDLQELSLTMYSLRGFKTIFCTVATRSGERILQRLGFHLKTRNFDMIPIDGDLYPLHLYELETKEVPHGN